ncbi:MAG TPA: tetratricopeptide repeat protein, partial [Nitrospirota bacterium]|nr:tetratricopeptide repeat protein [Nitrospirota bacterium]
LARVYGETDQRGKAAEQYREAIKVSPGDYRAYKGLMTSGFILGNPAESVWAGEEALKNGVPEEAITAMLGWAYYLTGDFAKAEPALKKAAESHERGDTGPLNNLGIFYFSQGRYDEALAEFAKAAELNKRSVVVSYFLALAYNGLGDREKALGALREGIVRDPELEKKIPDYKKQFFPHGDPGDLSALFGKLAGEKDAAP